MWSYNLSKNWQIMWYLLSLDPQTHSKNIMLAMGTGTRMETQVLRDVLASEVFLMVFWCPYVAPLIVFYATHLSHGTAHCNEFSRRKQLCLTAAICTVEFIVQYSLDAQRGSHSFAATKKSPCYKNQVLASGNNALET